MQSVCVSLSLLFFTLRMSAYTPCSLYGRWQVKFTSALFCEAANLSICCMAINFFADIVLLCSFLVLYVTTDLLAF